VSVVIKKLGQTAFLFFFCALLAACGGGNSTVTTITGNASGPDPAVSLPFVPTANNLKVSVESGGGFSTRQSANILYATVTVCVPGDVSRCQTIDHVQVDTGSIGLRILASKVSSLNLPPVMLDSAGGQAWECYPFVIGGLWGGVVQADVGLGQETASRIPVQLIDDRPMTLASSTEPTPTAKMTEGPADCKVATNEKILRSASDLDSNGILGIGSMQLDCGQLCINGNYAAAGYETYRSCPVSATDVLQCTSAKVQRNQQVFNPVAALPVNNNGVLLMMPAVSGLGAATASGELIFGINTQANNQLTSGMTQVHLGVDWQNNPDSYLNITTLYNGKTILNSYLDTGTNGLFFADGADNPIAKCQGSDWYCPTTLAVQHAVLSDGDSPQMNPVAVQFGVGNAGVIFSKPNAAFGDLAGAPPSAPGMVKASFSWGMPFFYGKKVFLSIWNTEFKQTNTMFDKDPWYSWSAI
jgi:hypothetical protein